MKIIKRILILSAFLFIIFPFVSILGFYRYALKQSLPENPYPTESYKYKDEILEVIWIETGGYGPIKMTPVGFNYFCNFFKLKSSENFKMIAPSLGITNMAARLITKHGRERIFKKHLTQTAVLIWISRNMSADEAIRLFAEKIYFDEKTQGMIDASKKYFDKEPNNLTLEEISVLISMTKNFYYNPWCRPLLSLKMTNSLLRRVYEERGTVNGFRKLKTLPESLIKAPKGPCDNMLIHTNSCF